MNEEKKKYCPVLPFVREISIRGCSPAGILREQKKLLISWTMPSVLPRTGNTTAILVPGKVCRLLLLPTAWERAEL